MVVHMLSKRTGKELSALEFERSYKFGSHIPCRELQRQMYQFFPLKCPLMKNTPFINMKRVVFVERGFF